MRVAVTSQNFRTVTPHAGRTRRFLVYDIDADAAGAAPAEVARLDLPKDMSMHEFKGDGPHPLDDVDVLIVGSCGGGFPQKMKRRGIVVAVTDRSEPLDAVGAYVAGRQVTPKPMRR